MVRRTGDTVQDFLDARSTPLIGSQVDSNWFCSCMAGLTFSHNTKLGGFYGKGVPLELIEKYGRDSLQVQLDFSREHGMEAGWDLRMNDLLRRIRRMADEVESRRGRPVLLAAHTPFSLADCLFIGVDLETWLKEGLIDLLCPGGSKESFFSDSYTDIIGLGHKYETPVYPCMSWRGWRRRTRTATQRRVSGCWASLRPIR